MYVWYGSMNAAQCLALAQAEVKQRTRSTFWRFGDAAKFELTLSEEAREGSAVDEVAGAENLQAPFNRY